jgi:MAE_28990/MAE_18760-like HEPN
MKIRSTSEFEDFIAEEYSWRRKELTNIRNMALSARKSTQEALIRSAVAILYAHWEGFIKQSSIAKIKYLSSKGYKYNQLAPSFTAFAALSDFDGQIPAKKFDAIAKLTGGGLDLDRSIAADAEKYIDTKSNLNSEVLKDIALKVCLDYSEFELKENLINESFLGLRNKICHGERTNISSEDFDLLYSEITALMDLFKTAILNSVFTKSFLKSVR